MSEYELCVRACCAPDACCPGVMLRRSSAARRSMKTSCIPSSAPPCMRRTSQLRWNHDAMDEVMG